MPQASEKEANRRKLQESLLRLSNLEEQIKLSQQQLISFNTALLETINTKAALNSLKSLPKDTPSLLPLGLGIFASGVLSKADKVLVDIGAGVVLEKSIDEATELLDTREENVRKNISLLQQSLTGLEKEYGQSSARVKKYAEEAQ